MPDSILVVEYEPRYIERVRQALSGHSQPNFAKDGEEAMKLLEGGSARLIVLSSIIPKISTAELIRKIRAMPRYMQTPILITVSGYNGRSPKADAVKLGASDILPKPYSEGEFLNKIRQLLEAPAAPAPEATIQVPKMSPSDLGAPEPTVVVQKISPKDLAPEPTMVVPKMTQEDLAKTARVSSNDIFGDLVDDSAAKKAAAKQSRSSAELDKLLETTLSGLQGSPKKAPSAPKPEARKSSNELDKLLETTLSGLDVPRPRTSADKVVTPEPKPEPKPEPRPVPKPEPKLEPKPAPPRVSPPMPEHTEQMAIPTAAELEAEKQRIEAARPTPPPQPAAGLEGSIPISSPVLSDRVSPPEEEDEAEDGIRFGQYILLEKIATGGMAEVWKARKRGVEGFQKTVAIKMILQHMSENEEFLTMFVDEAKLAAQLSHSNITHIDELGKQDDRYFIAMEYIDGEDLKSIIKRGQETMQPITIELAVFVASKIAAALDYAHRKRGFDEKELDLVHRDVSPQNVLISYEGDIKLCDFGIAKAASKASHTMAGALKGKLQYMSPEQAWGRSIDKRSDIFALAAVLFEMLTGQKLFVGDSEISVLEQVREARVKAPSSINDEVPPEVDRIVLKALAREPEQRYQTAGEMARDLEQILYTFRPTPTSADLAIHMHRLFVEVPPVMPSMPVHEESSAPEPEPEPFSSEPVALVPPQPKPAPEPIPAPRPPAPEPVPQPEPVATPPSSPAYAAETEEEKKFPVVPVAVAAVVLIAAIGVGAFLMKGGKSEPTQAAQAGPASVEAPVTPASDTIDPLATDTTTTDLVDPEASATSTALDQALIDQEVQKRLEAERARLDAQRQQDLKRADAAAQQPEPEVPTRQPDRPVQQQAATPPPAEEPPSATTTQAPPVVTPPPFATPKPPEQPAAPAVREGDLVAVGTPGLVAPTLVNFSKPIYPLVAKKQRVEGVVIVQVLISEAGKVLEAKVLRGVSQDVGINEAAIDAMKKSTFTPATLGGVKVKSHYTRSISFKL